MTRIAVNTRLLHNNQLDGIGWFTYNVLRHIVKKEPETEFHFFFDSPGYKEFLFADNVVPHKLFPPARHAILNVIWTEVSVKKKLKQIQPDLYFSPDGMLCLGWDGPQYGVIHDINFMHHPEFLKTSNRNFYRHYFPRYARKACRIATVSEYSKRDISSNFGVSPSLIDVVYCGINDHLHPIDGNAVVVTREKYTGGEPFFLFVGTLSPRKNVEGVLNAFEQYKLESGLKTKLVIAGGSMYNTKIIRDTWKQMKFREEVIFTGHVNNQELNNLYGSAISLIFVPFFEGFGIPIIEAMKCGLPVIASNTTSIPEVAGDAAIFVDPSNMNEIKNSMLRIALDPSLRKELIDKGEQRKDQFSWERTSDLLWEGIKKCL